MGIEVSTNIQEINIVSLRIDTSTVFCTVLGSWTDRRGYKNRSDERLRELGTHYLHLFKYHHPFPSYLASLLFRSEVLVMLICRVGFTLSQVFCQCTVQHMFSV